MSSPPEEPKRTPEQLGAFVFEIYTQLCKAKFGYDELVKFGECLYADADIGKMDPSAVKKLFGVARYLDPRFQELVKKFAEQDVQAAQTAKDKEAKDTKDTKPSSDSNGESKKSEPAPEPAAPAPTTTVETKKEETTS